MFSFLPGQSSGTKGNAPKKDSGVAAGFDFAIPDLNNVNEEDLLNDPDLMREYAELMGEEVPEPVVAVAQPKLVTKKQKSPQLVAVTPAPVVVHEHLEVDVDNVQVTEDDLKDPTLLAELRALGIEGDDDVADGAEDAVAQEETQGVIQDSVNETVDALDTNEAEKVPEDDGYLPLQEKLKCNDPAVLEKYIKLERMRALSFKRENNISAAKQAYDGSKKLQEKLDSILNLRNAPGNDHMQKREIAIQRANEYKKAALNAKIAGNITKAKEFLLSSKVIDDLLRKFDSGVSVDWSQMPPPIQEATNIPSSIPAPALKVPASVVKVEKRKLSGTKKVSLPEMEATVENYQDALKLLVTQVDKAKKYAKLFLVQGDLERSKRLDEISAIFTRDIATLKASKQAFSVRSLDLEFVVEDINDDIALNEMSISVIKGLGLVCKEVALGADLNCFVKWDVAWPPPDKPQSHLSKGETDKSRGVNPEWNSEKRIPIERTKGFLRHIERKKLILDIYHHKGFLWGQSFVGHAEIKLSDLTEKSEVHGIVDLMDANNRRPVGGKIEVKVRLREPLVEKQALKRTERWIVSETTDLTPFNSFLASRNQARHDSAPPQIVSPNQEKVHSAKITSTKSSPSSLESPTSLVSLPVKGETSEEINDLIMRFEQVDSMQSNNALEAELKELQHKVVHDKVKGKVSDEDEDRIRQIQIRLQLLVLQVQSEQLTMELYLQNVKKEIEETKMMAVAFKKAGKIDYAKRALNRMKIMQAEVQEAESQA